MRRVAGPIVVSTLVYLIVLGSLHPVDALTGLGFSLALALVFRRHVLLEARPAPAGALWLPRFLLFVGAVAWSIMAGAWGVLIIVLGLRPLPRSGIVAVPIETHTRLGLAMSALVVTIAPGTYLVSLDWKRRVMLIHALDATAPDSVRAHFHQFYERYQRPVFP